MSYWYIYLLLGESLNNCQFIVLVNYYSVYKSCAVLIKVTMFSLVRKVVAGPKRTTRYEGEDLDLTYITDRVIAMAFPASDMIEKTYRNNIDDVASYFDENHPQHYLIVNVSSRNYDYTAFSNRVKDYEWPDHQTPPFTTLIQVAYDMYKFLKGQSKGVVAVHCNHGKGRTGTAIISLMLLINFFRSAKECLKFYNSKRFNKNTYGVDQPCQLRYLGYIQRVLGMAKINPKMVCYRLRGITHRGLQDEDYYVNVSFTRNQQLVYEKVRFNKHLKESSKILLADIFIELFYENWTGRKKVARVNYNLFFLEGETKLRLKGENIKVEGGHCKQFQITLHLEYYCLCHLPTYEGSTCKCRIERMIEEKYWEDMIEEVRECKKITKHQAFNLLENHRERHQKATKQFNHLEDRIVHRRKSYRSFEGKAVRSNHQERLHAFIHNTIQKQVQTEEFQEEDNREGSENLQQNYKLQKREKQQPKTEKITNIQWQQNDREQQPI